MGSLAFRRIRSALLVGGIVLGTGCGEESSPPPPVAPELDGGDAALADASGDGGQAYVRPDGGPRLPGVDSEVTLPFLGPTQTVEVEIPATLRALDVHFSIDTTASFNDEIVALQRDLSERVVPKLRERIADVSVGVSSFEDFPHTPFGTEDDKPFELHTGVTSDLRRVDSALASLNRPIGNGGDGPESGAEALYQIATGEGYQLGESWLIDPYEHRTLPGGGRHGGVGYREGALRVLVHITDAPSHTPMEYALFFPATRSLEEAGDALADLGVRALGIGSVDPEQPDEFIPRPELEQLAFMTGAVAQPEEDGCPTGIDGEYREPVEGQCPLVFDVRDDGEGLSDTLIDAIVALVNVVDLRRAFTEVQSDPLRFVSAIEAIEAVAEPGTPLPTRRDERPEDGVLDTFENVRPGTTLRFAVRLRNTLLTPDDAPQFYLVAINLVGDGLSLGSHTIRVKIPARSEVISADAGTDSSQQDDASGM